MPTNLSVEEVVDQRDHLIGLVLQREMAGVEEMKLQVGQIALVRMRAIGGENLVVLAPDDQRRRLMLAEISLDGGIERQVGPVVVEEVELDLVVARAIEQRLVVDPIVGRDAADVGDAVRVLELRRLESDRASIAPAGARPSRRPNRP